MRFTTFTCQDRYEAMHSDFDSKYNVKMTLQELAVAYGQHITTFEECKVKADMVCANSI